jgi:ribosomal protein S18 acetylase RimI-like enzyme
VAPDASFRGFSYRWREERFRASLLRGSGETYVAGAEHEILGFVTLGAARDPDLDAASTGEIWGIYVSPDCWGKGIGRTLVAEAERILRSGDFERAVLWVLEANRAARRFYDAVGFVPDGTSGEIRWGTPFEALRYAKNLSLPGAGLAGEGRSAS